MPAEADEAEATDDIFLPFSLTKYSAIIAEVEGYFWSLDWFGLRVLL